MSSVSGYFRNIKNTATSIFEGLSVTFSWLFRRPMTIQYPDKIERPVEEMLPERYRGLLEVDIRYCIGCLACARNCPIECIVVGVEKHPESGDRMIRRFDIDVAKCMFCGLCVEACPTGCLHHTTLFEGTNSSIENLILRFVDSPVLPYKVKKGVDPAVDRSGRIARSMLKDFFAPQPEEFQASQRGEMTA